MEMKLNAEINDRIKKRSIKYLDPAERELQVLAESHAIDIAHEFNCSVRSVFIEALSSGVYPFRYVRNLGIITAEEQLGLAQSIVAVIGAGGLGGQVILLLARLGIGGIIVADHDSFDETNLNRQALSSNDALGKSKSDEAARVIASVNPGVEVVSHQLKFEEQTAEIILGDSDVVVDALDNIITRLLLEKAAKKLHIPLVHGAVAGLEGQVMTIFPEDKGLSNLYGEKAHERKGKRESPESVLGVPVMTPSTIASFQVMEVLKIILKRGKPLRNRMLYLDLESGKMNEFTFTA
ncbi:MAG: HesA/MoeB/ThiF family protein [Deltaproteobacteria bacterium]|nr:HesA/MoeB/ThiF family protein [Deltaproteobacteria bacterium]